MHGRYPSPAMLMAALRIGFLLFTALVGVSPAPAQEPPLRWHRISFAHHTSQAIDAAGNLWLRHDRYSVSMWPLEQRGWPPAPDAPGWMHRPLPRGYQAKQLTTTPDGHLYLVCEPFPEFREDTEGHNTVFRLPLDGSGPWEELPPPHTIGILFSPTVGADGAVWLGGERREVFRLDGDSWVKELTPGPLHNKYLSASPGGVLWAHGHSRLHQKFYYRDRGLWYEACDLSQTKTARLLWAGDTEAVVLKDSTLYRVPKQPGAAPQPWITVNRHLAVADSPHTLWEIRDRTLRRYANGVWTDMGPTPFVPQSMVWRDGRLFVTASTGLWVLAPLPPEAAPPAPLGLQVRRYAYEGDAISHYGVSVLRLHQRPFLYLVRHTQPDCVAPLFPQDRPEHWPEFSKSLGLNQIDESYDWQESYGMAAAAADLNADGYEDVVVATMYDGCRLLRNVEDKRFVSWTRESGIGGHGPDIAVDVDLFDADQDGDLDIYVTTLHGRDRLYLNNGAAVFTEALERSGMRSPDGGASALCRDLDGDGDTDVAVSTGGRGLYVHENVGSGRFHTKVFLTEIDHPQVPGGLTRDNLSGLGAADFNGDGRLDLVVARRARPLLFLGQGPELSFVEDPAMFASGNTRNHGAGVLCFDADLDGDTDVAVTGRSGVRFFECREGRLHGVSAPGLREGRRGATSTGAVVVDADADGDPDLFEAFLNHPAVLHENTNAGPVLRVRVQGPAGNRSAVGARVTVWPDGRPDSVVARHEVPGGSGYGSHDTKIVHVTGLDPAARYTVEAHLPVGTLGTVAGVPGEGDVVITMAGARAPWLETAAAAVRGSFKSVDGRRWWTALGLGLVLVGLSAGMVSSRSGTAFPWFGLGVVVLVAVAARAALPPAVKGLEVFVAPTAGTVAGLLAVAALARQRPRRRSRSLLSEFSYSLRAFAHNETPRKALDNLRLQAANAAHIDSPSPHLVRLLREDIERFRAVVAPAFDAVLDRAEAAGFEVKDGAAARKRVERSLSLLLDLPDAFLFGEGAVAALRELAQASSAFQEWVSSLIRRVDRRIAVGLRPFMETYVRVRGSLHPVHFEVEVLPVSVRMPEENLTELLDILLENAVRASTRRPVHVRIETAVRRSGRVQLRFTDDGPGVPASIRERVFQEGVSGAAGGSGQGLFLAKRLAQRYGGDLDLEGVTSANCFVLDLILVEDEESA